MDDAYYYPSFGEVVVLGALHGFISEQPDSVLIEDVSILKGVELRLGWPPGTERPYCGKCRHSLRAVEVDGKTVWVVDDGPHRRPVCSHTVDDTQSSDEELIENMWHEPDETSVSSWCHSAAIHLDDESSVLKFVAHTARHKVVVNIRLSPGGDLDVETLRKRRRRRAKRAGS